MDIINHNNRSKSIGKDNKDWGDIFKVDIGNIGPFEEKSAFSLTYPSVMIRKARDIFLEDKWIINRP